MGEEGIESVSEETESEETESVDETSEITSEEVESAFDETASEKSCNDICETEQGESHTIEHEEGVVLKTEVEKAFDEKETDDKNFVSGKEEKTEYYSEKSNLTKDSRAEVENIEGRYERPTGYRTGIRDQVWENAKDEHGRVRDPVSGRYMSKDQPWHMGHKPGYEFVKHQESAKRRGISREEFLDEHNNPDHYRPELPKSNMSHKGESKTENYYT